MTQGEFASKVKKARAFVDSLDKIDGFKDRELGTILAALEGGLKRPEDNSHFDAYVMLDDLVRGVRHGDKA